jgi:hypothetical protein
MLSDMLGAGSIDLLGARVDVWGWGGGLMGRASGSGSARGLSVHLVPWPVVRTAALRAWQGVRARHLLTGTSWEVLEMITRLQWVRCVQSSGRSLYAVPSERWLGGRLSLCRETMSDAVCVLEAHGLLSVTRRRPVHGRWQTNLYRLSGRLAATLIGSLRRGRGGRPVLSPSSPKGALSETAMSHAAESGALGSLMARWLARGQASGPGAVG